MWDLILSIYYKYLNDRIYAARVRYYKRTLKVNKLDIYFPVFIKPLENVRLGENVSINAFTHIWANATVEIGDNSMIASHVQITSSTHDYNVSPMRKKRIDRPVKIGQNVWIGTGAIIMPGVTIGDNSVIGAGALVRTDIPQNSIAYGVPAQIISEKGTPNHNV